jgi:acyl-coenzyme A thioesterase PaaI-like protein
MWGKLKIGPQKAHNNKAEDEDEDRHAQITSHKNNDDQEGLNEQTSQQPSNKNMTFSTTPEPIERLDSADSVILDSLEKLRLEPEWIAEKRREWGEKVMVPEWEEDSDTDNYRAKNGWLGRDLVHDDSAPVRVSEYCVAYGNSDSALPGFSRGGVGTVLTGIATFTNKAESHRGFCHGGSMTSVLDDVIGWCAFMTTGECKPWSGFTVQINTSLKKPIMVNTTLLIRGTITSVERRKVSVFAELLDPVDDSVHATGEGLVVLNKDVLPDLSRESSEILLGS